MRRSFDENAVALVLDEADGEAGDRGDEDKEIPLLRKYRTPRASATAEIIRIRLRNPGTRLVATVSILAPH